MPAFHESSSRKKLMEREIKVRITRMNGKEMFAAPSQSVEIGQTPFEWLIGLVYDGVIICVTLNID